MAIFFHKNVSEYNYNEISIFKIYGSTKLFSLFLAPNMNQRLLKLCEVARSSHAILIIFRIILTHILSKYLSNEKITILSMSKVQFI